MSRPLFPRSVPSCLLILMLVFLAGVPAARAQLKYRVTELRPVAGYPQSEAVAINELGVVVGSSLPSVIEMNGMATRWNGRRPQALGIQSGGTFSTAKSINKHGLVVGEGDDNRPNAVVYDGPSGGTFLTNGANNSYATYVTNSGLIFGILLSGFDERFLSVIWSPNPQHPGDYDFAELTWVDSTGLDNETLLLAANEAGQAVGYGFDAALGQVPVIWEANTTEGAALPGEPGTMPMGINDAGDLVGIGSAPGFTSVPVLWRRGPQHELVRLPLFPGETQGYAESINNQGIAIGFHQDLPAIWANGKIHDANSVLDPSGNGLVIVRLNDINNEGVIVGSATRNGVLRGVILTPLTNAP